MVARANKQRNNILILILMHAFTTTINITIADKIANRLTIGYRPNEKIQTSVSRFCNRF